MARVNKSEWINWKSHGVTDVFLQEMIGKIDSAIAGLVLSAGKDPAHDRYVCGQIDGLKWLVDWEPDFQEEDEDA